MCVGAVRFSIPHGWELPDGAESRVAQFSEDRDDLGRGGDRSWYARNVREEPSVAQLHLLLLISPFHIPWGFGCCLLFLSSGPSSRLCKHQRHPSLGVWRRFSPSSWEHSTLHPLRLGMGTRSCAGDRHSSFSQESSHVASAFWCVWGGQVTPKPRKQCSFTLLYLLHDSCPA